ncbi:MAG: YkgJ family cysteine cluster protein [Phycisphaerae bacterium]|nr:YkgJ family cysteine cluster protein [Phycisphaerae bacterium]NUQ45388.1 YkgJ family cysteine cluster protein [Phycisphaerae bacterium]
MDRTWYREGLKFTCTQCGNCCTGAPGYVWVTREERNQIAEFLNGQANMTEREYLRRVGFRHSLVERSNGDCIFLTNVNGKRICSIYPVRPHQCRTWPFWSSNLRSPQSWEAASRDCPGMNHGTHHGFVAIEDVRVSNKWEGVSGWH